MRVAGEGRARDLVAGDAVLSGDVVVVLAGLPAAALGARKIRDFERKNQGLPDSVLDRSGIRMSYRRGVSHAGSERTSGLEIPWGDHSLSRFSDETVLREKGTSFLR
jgi:hypothetical protein